MMIRTRGRRLVSRLEALERVYDTRRPRVFRFIFEYGGEPTIITYFRDENRTEIIEPPPPDDDPDEFFGAGDDPHQLDGTCESTDTEQLAPAPQPYDEIISDPHPEVHASVALGSNRIVPDKVQLRQNVCKQSRGRKSAVHAPRNNKRSHCRDSPRDERTPRFRSAEARHAVPTARPQPKRPAPLAHARHGL